MSFRIVLQAVVALMSCMSCSQYRKIELVRSGEVKLGLNIHDEAEDELVDVVEVGNDAGVDISDGMPFIMNAIVDEETGEMVATDVLSASSVSARFLNVAERAGFVTIGFDINVPAGMVDSKFRLKLYPKMIVQEDTVELEPVIVTGTKYREGQLRGYERYRRFIASIVTDTTDFIRIGQLEIFLQRHFPQTYKMRTDSSLISDPHARTLFGASQEEAVRHYTKKLQWSLNEKRISRRDEMFRKYVKDPIEKDGIRLDTVFRAENGDFVYGYVHTFRSRPQLKKVTVSIDGTLFSEGMSVASLPKPDDLVFYISTLSTLVDDRPKYRTVVIERQVNVNTKAYLDFKVGSAIVDTALGNNASELMGIRRCIEEVIQQSEYVLDSLIIVASCSPDGSWRYNGILAERRSSAVLNLIRNDVPEEFRQRLKSSCIPEDWETLREIVKNDTMLTSQEQSQVLKAIEDITDPDMAERRLGRHPRYGYIRKTLYPRLRSVSFDFHLHRTGMVKDTVHTEELDSLYMSGINALMNLDYASAVEKLGPYRDYNAALACLLADMNHTALEMLTDLNRTNPKVCYLLAVVYARLGLYAESLNHYRISQKIDPSLRHRANLDPELSSILKLNN